MAMMDRLKEGISVSKLNRQNRWQSRVLTVTKEEYVFNNGADDARSEGMGSCPRGLLWMKKFRDSERSVSSIGRKGRGGLFFSTVESVSVTEGSDDSFTLVLHSNDNGSKRDICFRCATKDDVILLSTGFQAIVDRMKHDEQLKSKSCVLAVPADQGQMLDLLANELAAARKDREAMAALLGSSLRGNELSGMVPSMDTRSATFGAGAVDEEMKEKEGEGVRSLFPLEQLETGEKTSVELAEYATRGCPRHKIGCTPYECHGALMEKEGFGKVQDSDAPSMDEKLSDATAFLSQYAAENDGAYDGIGGLEKRLEQVKLELMSDGMYQQSFDELQYGCRLAWRNSGRCIMRKVSFTLELLDCRSVTTAEEAFEKIKTHLAYAANDGFIKPVIR